jgi:8-oxo-dGTP pyrophosphatase MutT (NUDIX family)
MTTLTENAIQSYSLIEPLTAALSSPLPGIEAQATMAPGARLKEIFQMTHDRQAIQSGVMILLYARQGVMHTVMIRRPEYPGIHSGQMAFPGGRFEAEDADMQATALRETEEEIGISRNTMQIAGALSPLYIPPSNYMVHPFVGFTSPDPVFTPDPSEVAEVVEIPLLELLNPGSVKHLPPAPEFKFMDVPAYVIGRAVIWGATAMITAEFMAVIHRNEIRRWL